MQTKANSAEDIIKFWIGTAIDDPVESQKRNRLWFNSNPSSDKKIKYRFGNLLAMAEQNQLNHWSNEAEGSLALVILLDQFSRNIYRGTHQAFQNDARALKAAVSAVDKYQDLELSLVQRAFLYLPFEHAESMTAQDRSVELFSQLEQSAPEAWASQMKSFAYHARGHWDIVNRFGRYPHRNRTLGRESSSAEKKYLDKIDKRFGQ